MCLRDMDKQKRTMKLDGIDKAFIIMMISLILAGVSKQMPLQDNSQSKDIPLQPDTQGNLNTTYQLTTRLLQSQ